MSIWWKWCNWSISVNISRPSGEQSMKHETSWNMKHHMTHEIKKIKTPKQNETESFPIFKTLQGASRPWSIRSSANHASWPSGSRGNWWQKNCAKHLGFLEVWDLQVNMIWLHQHDGKPYCFLCMDIVWIRFIHIENIWKYGHISYDHVPIYPWCPPWLLMKWWSFDCIQNGPFGYNFIKPKVPSCGGICNKACFHIHHVVHKSQMVFSKSRGISQKDSRFRISKNILITTHFITRICLYDEPFMKTFSRGFL